jgi:hypothetical protein
VKGKKNHTVIAIIVWIVAILVIAIAVLSLVGCASSKPVATPPVQIEYTPILIPVPGPELQGPTWEEFWADLQTPTLSRGAVEEDGSVLIQSLTHDFLICLDELKKAFNRRRAYNASRGALIEAQREAEAELERLRSQ